MVNQNWWLRVNLNGDRDRDQRFHRSYSCGWTLYKLPNKVICVTKIESGLAARREARLRY